MPESSEGLADVVIVDDDPSITTLCRLHLERVGGLRVVGSGGTAAAGFDQALTHRPDVVLVDLGLPDRSGEALIGDLLRVLPETMVAAFTSVVAERAEARVRATGAFAYYEKDLLRDGRLGPYLRADLELFARAVRGEDVVAPSATERRDHRAG